MNQSTLANPAPLGLLGFGVTTFLLNFHNAGYTLIDGPILMMGIFYGGVAQIIAGILEAKKGNTFAFSAFTSYGLFWLTLVGILFLDKYTEIKIDSLSFGVYLFTWGVITLLFFIDLIIKGALWIGKSVFLSLTVLFFLLALGQFTGNETVLKIAGYEGMLVGILAIIDAFMQIYKK